MSAPPRLNLLDRAIAAFDPERGARRLKARTQIALGAMLGDGYNSSNGSSGAWTRKWNHGVRDSASDTLRALPTLRGQSRDLVRNQAYAASVIGTKVNRAVGTGLALSAQPQRQILGWDEDELREWKRIVHAEFSMFADSTECDIRNTLNFYDQQALVLRAMLESGDCFTVMPDGQRTATMPYALRLQVLEADRVGNPLAQSDTTAVAGGIRRTTHGAPAAYHVYDQHPGTMLLNAGNRYKGQWIEAVGSSGRRRILHHFAMLRPEQPRGVPDLAPVMELFKHLGTYTDAEIKAAVVSSFLTVFIENDSGNPAPVFGMNGTGAANADGSQQASADLELGPAAVLGLAKGEKPTVVDPTRPNPAFGPFVQAIVDQLGAGTLIGPEMLSKKYNTSYVAARAAFLDAWKHLLDLRTRIARTLCQPVYETWMAEAVAIGRVRAPGFFRDPLLRWAYTRSNWSGDSQGSINPAQEVKAYLDAIEGNLLSRERAEWELFGTDFNETYDTKKAERDRLKADDMLPAPKAGAPAPIAPEPDDATADPAKPKEPTPAEQATLNMTAAITALAAREQPAHSIHITTPPVEVQVTTPPITVEGHEINVTLPEGCIQLEATVQAPQVQVDVAVPEPVVTVNNVQQATRQLITRDAEGEMTEIVTTLLAPPAH
jgi:lambda family phage portal protein